RLAVHLRPPHRHAIHPLSGQSSSRREQTLPGEHDHLCHYHDVHLLCHHLDRCLPVLPR
ncbi:hypothetical protein BN1723_019983, partial [Verticillium longisporum]